jgi:VanZ family protein
MTINAKIKPEFTSKKTGKARVYARWFSLISVLLMTWLLFYLNSKPFTVGLILPPWDKLAHLLMFSLMTTLLWIGVAGRQPLLLVGLVSAIGALDEWHQSYIPGRSVDFVDLLTDIASAILTVLVLQSRPARSA